MCIGELALQGVALLPQIAHHGRHLVRQLKVCAALPLPSHKRLKLCVGLRQRLAPGLQLAQLPCRVRLPLLSHPKLGNLRA